MNTLLQDLAFAWRGAIKNPGAALLIVITLALGIGANTAMFSMAWHVLAAPLPYADGDRLVLLRQNESKTGTANMPWSLPTFRDFQSGNRVFSNIAEYFQTEYTLLGHGAPHLALTGVVNWRFFDVLGIRPELGRGFSPADGEPGAVPVMLISDAFWRDEFAASPKVIGASLEMNARSYTVIGVLPKMPAWPRANDVWLTNAGDVVMSDPSVADVRAPGLVTQVIGKLKPGVDMATARTDMDQIVGQLLAAYPDVYSRDRGYRVDLRRLRDDLVGDAGRSFLLLLGLAFLVVLIVSANVANLNLARLAARSQELAVREAVGASPGRLRRQLFTESLLFSLAGGSLGLLIAYPCLSLLADFAAGYTPLAGGIGLDASVLLFSLLVAGLTGVFSGVAMILGRRDINRALKEGGDKVTTSPGANRRGQALLVVQLALAFLVLATTALIVISLARLTVQDPGYEVTGIITGSTLLDLTPGVAEDPRKDRDFVMDLLKEIDTMPGVAGAAAAGFPMLQDPNNLYTNNPVKVEGRSQVSEDSAARTLFAIVSEDYFAVMDIPLLAGRLFVDTDDEKLRSNSLVVNQAFARRYFPKGHAIGQRISFTNGAKWDTIVGVVANARSRSLNRLDGPVVYINYRAGPTTLLNLYIKGKGALIGVRDAINRRLREHQVPIIKFKPLSQVRDQWLAPFRLRAWLIGLFGLLALLVTLSGVVGLVSHNVSRRLREIGVRMAVGASPSDIVRSFLIAGLKLLIPGLLLGLALMLAGAPLLQTVLYQTRALNPLVYLLVAAVLSGAVLAAVYAPARKAARLEPRSVLQVE